MLVWKKILQTRSAVLVKPISYLITCKRFPVLITDLGEIAHLPKPITPHVRFQFFVLNVLPWISASLDDPWVLSFALQFHTAPSRVRRFTLPGWPFQNHLCHLALTLSHIRGKVFLLGNSFFSEAWCPLWLCQSLGVMWRQQSGEEANCPSLEVEGF